ncbi:MAG: 4-hydroxybenzoate octaprenyltransferase [Pseudomonadales bacterium]|nr:4-hydroxybenzoate octaprenyltransferase [Pseudomonadales bacterium]
MNIFTRQLDRFAKRFPKSEHLVALTRLNKPIGIYLLLWPTLWSLWIAAEGFPGLHLFLVFVLGTIITRSAGCIINDIADREFDGRVQRTQSRPLATGVIDVSEALLLLAILLIVALALVLTTNFLTLGLAILAALIALIYPFMKRYTYLPQVVLGIAFSFGIPMSFAATLNSIPNIAWLLLIANLVWTVAYDTEYAMVDREDDLKLGLKSTAILFADLDKMMIGMLQVLFICIMLLVANLIELNWPYYVGLLITAGCFIYQQYLIRHRRRAACFNAFLNNHWIGLAIFISIIIHYWANPT